MILTLEVIAPQPTTLGGASRQTFHGEGGSIGRDDDNSWVLPHPKVSGHHAVISHRNEVFYIEDTSRNGVSLNSSTNRLKRGRPCALTSGDRILIDPYEIRVSITRDQNGTAERSFGELSNVRSSDARSDLSRSFDMDDPFAPRPVHSLGLESGAEAIADQALDPLELLNLSSTRAPVRQARSAEELERGSPLDGHYQPPEAIPGPASRPRAEAIAIPHDYDPLAPDDTQSVAIPSLSVPPRTEPMATRPHEERATPPLIAPVQTYAGTENSQAVRDRAHAATSTEGADTADLAAVLAGAGLDPANVTPELARSLGQILRVVVSGVMDVMRSRQEIKDEFGMRPTRFRTAENNPLKFSANVDDALHNLLVKHNPAYLAPVEAFEDAFADLRNHQVAMLAGIRMAFESMLAEFDPDRLQLEFDRQLGKGLMLGKLRYWDLYRERSHDIGKDPEASFRRLFGEEFARVYAEQVKQLTARSSNDETASSRTPQQTDT